MRSRLVPRAPRGSTLALYGARESRHLDESRARRQGICRREHRAMGLLACSKTQPASLNEHKSIRRPASRLAGSSIAGRTPAVMERLSAVASNSSSHRIRGSAWRHASADAWPHGSWRTCIPRCAPSLTSWPGVEARPAGELPSAWTRSSFSSTLRPGVSIGSPAGLNRRIADAATCTRSSSAYASWGRRREEQADLPPFW